MTSYDQGSRRLPPLATRELLLIAAAVFALLVAVSGRYGYHRDELYFLQCGRHLAWGYPDQPPFVPFIARVVSEIAAGSLVVLRLPSALATAATVFLAGLMARELGGGRGGQALAAGGIALANVVLGSGHLLSTTTFGFLVWSAVTMLSLRAVRTGNDRLWLAVGVVGGIGLLDSDLVAFLMLALVAGVLAAGPRRIFTSPWLYVGAGVMLALWAPYLVWQASHGWPELTVARHIANGGSGTSAARWQFVPFQFLMAGIWLTPLWLAGLVRLVRDPALRWARAVPVAYVVLTVVFVATGGKPYYIDGLLPVLFAAGAPPVLDWCRRGRRLLLVPAAAVLSILGLVIVLPLLPVSVLHRTPVVALNYDAGETVGWPTYVTQIALAYDRLPVSQRSSAIVLASNYGEGGAVDRYGAARGLPAAYSVHNAFWLWGPPPSSTRHAVAVGFDVSQLRTWFSDVRVVRHLDNGHQVDNDEQGVPVALCSGPRTTWPVLWQHLKVYG